MDSVLKTSQIWSLPSLTIVESVSWDPDAILLVNLLSVAPLLRGKACLQTQCETFPRLLVTGR